MARLILSFLLLVALSARADNEKNAIGIPPYLFKYEPNYVGFTHDADAEDNVFFDFKISVMAPLFPNWFNFNTRQGNLFLAVTIRAGQYMERESAPVIGKLFSPQLFYRHWDDSNKNEDSGYIDIGYVHESNGQSINTQEQYQQRITSEQDPSEALDYVSRGWDYIELRIKRGTLFHDSKYAGSLNLKHFLDHGMLQSKSENYYSWVDGDEINNRNRVNGIKLTVSRIHGNNFDLFNVRTRDYKTELSYETGAGLPFVFHTIRVAETLRLFEIPVMVWYQYGYSNDLAQYYKKTSSYGIAYEIGSF